MIQGGGLNGTADIIWVAVFQMKTLDKLKDGKRLPGILLRLPKIVVAVIYSAEPDKDKRCYIGLTTVESFSK